MAESESGNGAPKGSGEASREIAPTHMIKRNRWVTWPPEGWEEAVSEAVAPQAEAETPLVKETLQPAKGQESAAPPVGLAWYRSDGQLAAADELYDTRPAAKSAPRPAYIIRRAFRDVIFPLVIAFAVAMFAQATVAKPYQIPSGSMLPTIQLQDRILANRVVYHFHPVQHGDVVVFTPPAGLEQEIPYVKRVIGLPGDTVEVRGGHTYVNGEESIVPEATRPSYTRAPDRVPDGMMFVLGDNRNESSDSHIWGYVPMDNIIGRADVIYWPPHDFQLLGN